MKNTKSNKQTTEKFNVKKIINDAKSKKLIKPLSEAFDKNPVENEKHKGNANYFLN